MGSRKRSKKRSRRSSGRTEDDGELASPSQPEVQDAPQAEEPPVEDVDNKSKSRLRRRSQPASFVLEDSDEEMAPVADADVDAAAPPAQPSDLIDSVSDDGVEGSDKDEEESGKKEAEEGPEEVRSDPEASPAEEEEESGSEDLDEEDLEEESEEDDEELSSEDDRGRRRSSRRKRETPGRPRRRSERLTRGAAAAGRYAESDGEDDVWGASHPGRRFASRYSSRNRRQVDRFDPEEGHLVNGSGGSGNRARAAKRTRREERHAAVAAGFGSDAPTDLSVEEESESEDLGSDFEEEEGLRRKKYEFRDREAVSGGVQGKAMDPAAAAAPEDGAARRRRFSARRRGGGRYGGEIDELPLPRAGATAGPLALGPALAPWAAALAAVGLGPADPAAVAPTPGAHPAIAAAGASRPPGGTNAASLEINPLEVDPSVSFDHVGGLGQYVRALKEMIWLPLVYPELFERFQVTPPRGVLFYGPPGTGKTLVARALAAHASRAAGAGRKVSFFMRKGADLLNKYVGESERMLRMLFEEARRRQPSIIFFDEIDGLAPVRSSRSDQIHNSIVSTLLALMDGLDPRGQVVIIGATNRVDALDGALRRPGRFDRELLFPLPSQSARRDILGIHTRSWAEPPAGDLLDALAGATVGYCGADIKALCTEASLAALRRRYPQIYDSEHKLVVDPAAVQVERKDFLSALESVTPASHRAAAAPGRPLPAAVGPALLGHLQAALGQLQRVFPPAAACLRDGTPGSKRAPRGAALGGLAALCVQRPRLLVAGAPGCGQAHIGPALLYALEGLQAHAIGLPSLLADAGARSPEEALVHAMAEARRAAPAVLYLPHLQAWWAAAPPSLRATLRALLADLPPDLPLLLLATADAAPGDLDPEALALFGGAAADGIYSLSWPTHGQRSKLFETVATALIAPDIAASGTSDGAANGDGTEPEQLPRAPGAEAAEEAAKRDAEALAARRRYEEDQAALRALRMVLRWVLDRLFQARRWEAFFEPVDPKEDPKFYEFVSQPMDLSTLLSRVDARRYATPGQFLADVALIPAGERAYWRDLPEGVRHISRACALEDEARSLTEAAVPAELRAKVEAIAAAGGPAPLPPGLEAAMGLPGGGVVAGTQAERMDVEAGGAEGAEKEGVEEEEAGQRATRRAGQDIDRRIVHVDPEAQARRIKALKRTSSAAAAAVASGGEEMEVEAAAEAAADVPQVLAPLENVVEAAGVKGGEREPEQGRQMVVKPSTATAAAPEPTLSPQQQEQVAALQAALAERTGGLSLESLEEINAQLGRLAWERQGEADRRVVADAALRTADELAARLKP